MIVAYLVPTTVLASVETDNAYFTKEEFESYEHIYADGITTHATNLIDSNNLGIAKKRRNYLTDKWIHIRQQ